MQRFYSFSELIRDFSGRKGAALEFSSESGPETGSEGAGFAGVPGENGTVQVTYPELAAMILERAEALRGADTKVDPVVAVQSVETVVRIFADVIAGIDVIMADPLVPEEAVKATAAAALATRAIRHAADPDGEGELLFFTSGTTSRSKVVRLTSRSLCASAWSGQSMLACGPDDRLLSILPLAHVFGFVCAMLWGLAYGATILLGRGVRHLVDDALFFKPTIIPAVPSLIGAMLRFDALNPELRVALIGAAPCTPEVTAALRAKGIDVYLGYGLTETSSGIAITQDLDEPEALYACPGADIQIDPDGEVSVATPCLMQGYLGLQTLKEGTRFYTGDIGSFDEKGRLRLQGRKKDVLILADGTKVFCPEFEDDLTAMTGVKDLAVILKDGRAALVASTGNAAAAQLGRPQADPDEFLAKLNAAVTEYNRRLPRSQQICGITLTDEELPRTVTGKLKRYALQELYA